MNAQRSLLLCNACQSRGTVDLRDISLEEGLLYREDCTLLDWKAAVKGRVRASLNMLTGVGINNNAVSRKRGFFVLKLSRSCLLGRDREVEELLYGGR